MKKNFRIACIAYLFAVALYFADFFSWQWLATAYTDGFWVDGRCCSMMTFLGISLAFGCAQLFEVSRENKIDIDGASKKVGEETPKINEEFENEFE